VRLSRGAIGRVLVVVLLVGCQAKVSPETLVDGVLWEQSDPSYNNYRIPALIVTKSNTLLAFAEGREGGDAGDIDILLRRSMNNGVSWEEQIVVWDDGTNTCGNPCPVVDEQTGRILLLMTWNLGSDGESAIIRRTSDSTRVPYLTYSDDDGLTWSEPRSLYEAGKDPAWGWYATGPGVGIQLKAEAYKGRLVVPCNNSYDNPEIASREGFGYGAHVLLSDDGGDSWRRSEIITPEVNESQVAELANGTLLMNMRSYNQTGTRAVAYSADGGETWSSIEHDPQLIEPVCQGSLLSFGDWEGQKLHLFSNPSVQGQRTHMTIQTSFDDCQTWTNAKLIYQGPSAYSCLTRLPNGHVALFFEMGEERPYEQMRFVSFSPQQLFSPGVLSQ